MLHTKSVSQDLHQIECQARTGTLRRRGGETTMRSSNFLGITALYFQFFVRFVLTEI